ncbi:PASTA domain-containing protein [Kitasatospora sp. NPDC008050]|uniref:PASTA domain-containing protein n=1 Tax=Kitasatospora sp. NPDC008050 TaxID=3364021 RepID=UPI0036EF07A7
MTPLPADDHRDRADRLVRTDPTPDSAFGKALTQAMDNFANEAPTPAFDGSAILHRTRRRRAVLTVAASAAAVALAGGTAFALHAPNQPPSRAVAAVAGLGADHSPTPSPAASPTGNGNGNGNGTPSPVTSPTGTPTGTPTGDAPSPSPSMGHGTPSAGPDTSPQPGQAVTIVPNLVGQSQAAAEQALIASGLLVGRVQPFTDWHVPAGVVISMSPAGGTRLPAGATVDIFVSTGKP